MPKRLRVFVVSAVVTLGCGGDSPTGPSVANIEVVPGEMLLVGEGDGDRYVARGRDAEGTIVSVTPEWSIDESSVASITADGFVTAISAGLATVTATAGGASGSARLEVYIPPHIGRFEPGRSYFGRNDYVEYIPGELPVILSSAHGGALQPGEIPNRTFGVVINDRNSLELTLAMSRALVNLTGHAPHVILSHLHRSKLDANRE
ncbi:MAG: Ig-like domain-containing protein, partial [Gemmatimonadota bacterium]|nr:Ig-like domain-containing protein [Gemmatimonadota bacterium]